MKRGRARVDGGAIALLAGVAAGAAAAVYFGWRGVRRRRWRAELAHTPFAALEQATVDALRDDARAGQRAIDVAALGEGIIELTGTVTTEDEARRAVEVAQGVAGIHTVVNRLAIGAVEAHIVRTRRRFEEGDPALNETHWYGVGVGIGRRRQGAGTDPDQRDDRVDRVTRVLEPSSMPVVESDIDTGTATELTLEEARRLAPQPGRRPTGPH
jgi:hypothetical protein